MLNIRQFGLSALCVMGLSLFASAGVQAQSRVNSIYALSGGAGWNFRLTDVGPAAPSEFSFYSEGTLYRGPVLSRNYDAVAQTVNLQGNLTNSNVLRYTVTYAPGGLYNQGTSTLIIFQDINGNGAYNIGDIILAQTRRPFPLVSSSVTFASGVGR